MIKYNDVIFYSKEHNILLASKVKEILSKKERGVNNIDDIDDIFINGKLSFKYLILDFSKSSLDERSITILQKMLKGNLIQEIVIITNNNLFKIPEFIYVNLDEDFTYNFSRTFDKIIEREINTINEVAGIWRKIISQQLCDWGFSSNTMGYLEIIDSIIYYAERKGVIKNFNKEVYIYLSNKYRATTTCVELSIRKAIKKASLKKDKFPKIEKLTNKGFITYAISQLYDNLIENRVIKTA